MSLLKCAFALLALVPLIPLWGTNHLQWHARLTYFPTEATRVGPFENVLIPKIAISDRRNVNIGGQSSNLWAVVSRNDTLVSPKLENLKIPDDYQAVSEESQRNISQPRITHQQKQTLVNILFFSIFLSIIGALIVIAGNETGFILILLALLIAFDANGVEEAFFR